MIIGITDITRDCLGIIIIVGILRTGILYVYPKRGLEMEITKLVFSIVRVRRILFGRQRRIIG